MLTDDVQVEFNKIGTQNGWYLEKAIEEAEIVLIGGELVISIVRGYLMFNKFSVNIQERNSMLQKNIHLVEQYLNASSLSIKSNGGF